MLLLKVGDSDKGHDKRLCDSAFRFYRPLKQAFGGF